MNQEHNMKFLPPETDLQTATVLKQLISSHKALAELKGVSATIPNENILISTLTLQEAKDSSAIENIITTQDELYKTRLFEDFIGNASAKEVSRYADALQYSFYKVRESKLITTETILNIQQILENNTAGFRKLPGTKLVNEITGEVVYIPPQNHSDIIKLMDNLIAFINDDEMYKSDPLVKMAIIHYQFESIHPFYDGNGRTGRIINILYLVLKELLNLPILYLSRYIINNKNNYYRLLQQVRTMDNWEEWILYILKGIEETAQDTIVLINKIKILMQEYKHRIRQTLPQVYSQDLLNNIFKHPYTKIEYLMQDIGKSRPTTVKYLDLLVENKFLEKVKLFKNNYYVNIQLYNLLKTNYSRGENVDKILTVNDQLPK